MVLTVDYLGYVIDARGLHLHSDIVLAIQQVPKPLNVTQLKSYLGLLLYYGKFLPNLSTKLASHTIPVVGKDVSWKWSSEQESAPQASKDLLTSSKLLVHFNPQLPLLLVCAWCISLWREPNTESDSTLPATVPTELTSASPVSYFCWVRNCMMLKETCREILAQNLPIHL